MIRFDMVRYTGAVHLGAGPDHAALRAGHQLVGRPRGDRERRLLQPLRGADRTVIKS